MRKLQMSNFSRKGGREVKISDWYLGDIAVVLAVNPCSKQF